MKRILTKIKQLFTPCIYYFAYGSNMLQERLEKRVGHVVKVGTGKIQDFQLTFDTGNDKASFANIKLVDGEEVYGVIYKMSVKQLRVLDYYEGNPLFYERMVEPIGKIFVEVYINERKRESENRPTSKDYLYTLINGAKENYFPLDYIAKLESIDCVQESNLYA